jgi:Pyruvate/2-oxoacid:ferredoxin oxidoreductase gamma subunit
MMGGLARVLGMPAMSAITEAIKEEVPSKPKPNMKAAEMAYKQVRVLNSVEDSTSSTMGA